MLVERLGEGVAARAVGDEEQVGGAHRIGDRLHRRFAWIADRARRQPFDGVGVVGRRLQKLGLRNAVSERAFAADEAIDDRRIGLELHPLLQAVDEDAGDMRALLRLARLLFDNGGHRHELARRFDRQIRRALLPDLVDRLGLRDHHRGQDLGARDAAFELIRLGKDRTLAGRLLDVADEHVVVA